MRKLWRKLPLNNLKAQIRTILLEQKKKNLPPLSLSEEVEKYQAHLERKEVSLKGCNHKSVKFEKGELRCTCGAAWSGPRLQDLYDALTSQ